MTDPSVPAGSAPHAGGAAGSSGVVAPPDLAAAVAALAAAAGAAGGGGAAGGPSASAASAAGAPGGKVVKGKKPRRGRRRGGARADPHHRDDPPAVVAPGVAPADLVALARGAAGGGAAPLGAAFVPAAPALAAAFAGPMRGGRGGRDPGGARHDPHAAGPVGGAAAVVARDPMADVSIRFGPYPLLSTFRIDLTSRIHQSVFKAFMSCKRDARVDAVAHGLGDCAGPLMGARRALFLRALHRPLYERGLAPPPELEEVGVARFDAPSAQEGIAAYLMDVSALFERILDDLNSRPWVCPVRDPTFAARSITPALQNVAILLNAQAYGPTVMYDTNLSCLTREPLARYTTQDRPSSATFYWDCRDWELNDVIAMLSTHRHGHALSYLDVAQLPNVRAAGLSCETVPYNTVTGRACVHLATTTVPIHDCQPNGFAHACPHHCCVDESYVYHAATTALARAGRIGHPGVYVQQLLARVVSGVAIKQSRPMATMLATEWYQAHQRALDLLYLRMHPEATASESSAFWIENAPRLMFLDIKELTGRDAVANIQKALESPPPANPNLAPFAGVEGGLVHALAKKYGAPFGIEWVHVAGNPSRHPLGRALREIAVRVPGYRETDLGISCNPDRYSGPIVRTLVTNGDVSRHNGLDARNALGRYVDGSSVARSASSIAIEAALTATTRSGPSTPTNPLGYATAEETILCLLARYGRYGNFAHPVTYHVAQPACSTTNSEWGTAGVLPAGEGTYEIAADGTVATHFTGNGGPYYDYTSQLLFHLSGVVTVNVSGVQGAAWLMLPGAYVASWSIKPIGPLAAPNAVYLGGMVSLTITIETAPAAAVTDRLGERLYTVPYIPPPPSSVPAMDDARKVLQVMPAEVSTIVDTLYGLMPVDVAMRLDSAVMGASDTPALVARQTLAMYVSNRSCGALFRSTLLALDGFDHHAWSLSRDRFGVAAWLSTHVSPGVGTAAAVATRAARVLNSNAGFADMAPLGAGVLGVFLPGTPLWCRALNVVCLAAPPFAGVRYSNPVAMATSAMALGVSVHSLLTSRRSPPQQRMAVSRVAAATGLDAASDRPRVPSLAETLVPGLLFSFENTGEYRDNPGASWRFGPSRVETNAARAVAYLSGEFTARSGSRDALDAYAEYSESMATAHAVSVVTSAAFTVAAMFSTITWKLKAALCGVGAALTLAHYFSADAHSTHADVARAWHVLALDARRDGGGLSTPGSGGVLRA